MLKQELLNEVKSALMRGEVTKQDLISLTSDPEMHAQVRNNRIATVLYYVGGLIVFLGIGFYVSQKWDDLSSLLRIIVTLGFGIGFSVAGTALFMKHMFRGIGDAFHLISGLMIPGGIFVTLYELEYVGGRYGTSIIFLTLALLAFIEWKALKRIISLVWTWIYSSIGYLLLGLAIIIESPAMRTWDIPAYLILTLGLAYISIGYALRRQADTSTLTAPMYFFGVPAILGSTLYLQGYYPDETLFWEIVYPGILFGAIFLSVYVKSRSFLIFGTLFLLGYIGKIMAEYFQDSVSGALLLIISGIIVMAVGYMTFWINHKYFQKGSVVTES